MNEEELKKMNKENFAKKYKQDADEIYNLFIVRWNQIHTKYFLEIDEKNIMDFVSLISITVSKIMFDMIWQFEEQAPEIVDDISRLVKVALKNPEFTQCEMKENGDFTREN